MVRRQSLQHEQHSHHHVDIEEEPGTYRSNWACMGAMMLGLVALGYGLKLLGTSPSLGAGTMAVGALVLVLNASRVFAGTTRWASQLTIILGVWTWYSAHFFGVDPNVFENQTLGTIWGVIGIGLGYVFMGTWATLGAPGKVEWEPFWYPTES
jgi:hypothetical protein